ncbi:MAG: ankyrin repeat domain-containing protein [Crocinitomicaceae bacterium]|nr:ankyrin repeat domain-containing protein [Crocinitomicaceae bacterium]
MKRLLFASFVLTTLVGYSQQFCAAPFKASDIAVTGNHVWMIGESDEKGAGIFYNQGNTWKYYTGVTGEKIFVGKDNRPIVINAQGMAYQLNGTSWQNLSGQMSEVAVAPNNGMIWCVQNGNIYSYMNGQWTPFNGAQIASAHIDFDPSGTMYSINTSGYVFKQNGMNWTLLGTKQAKDLTIDESGKIWIVSKEWEGTGYKIYYWGGNNWVAQTGGAVKMDAGSSSELWKIDNSGAVYRKQGSTWAKKSLNPLNANSSGNTNTGPVNYGDNVTQVDQYGETSLFKAVRNNDIPGIYTLLGKGSNINHLNHKQQNALFTACQLGFDRVVQLLVNQKINVNQKDTLNMTPLLLSIQKGDSLSVGFLLESGALANQGNVVDAVLDYNKASNKDAGLIMRMVVEKGALVNPGHFNRAALQNNTESFDALSIHADKYLRENEILEIAITKKNPVIANICVENGASAEKGLDLGIETSNTQLITTSLSKGADAKKAIKFAIDSKNSALLDLCLTLKKDTKDYAMDYAAEKKDSVSMDICIKYGGSINTVFPKLVESNDMNIIQYGLNKNADPSLGLEMAVKKNNMPVVQMLFNNGAQVKTSSVIAAAADNQNKEMVLLLIQKGAAPGDGLVAALTKNNKEIVELLLAHGASGGAPTVVETAAKYSSPEILQMILNKGGLAQNGLMPAIEAQKTENVKILLQGGASPSDSQLMEKAVELGNLEIVTQLINFGGDPNAGIKIAVNKFQNDILKYLISKGGSVSDGSLFVNPINMNQIETVKILINSGCNVTYTDIKQNNLLHIAGAKARTDIARLLIATSRININAKNDVGDSPLHLVVDTKNLELTQIYVEAGADINATNSMGKLVYKVARGAQVKKYLKKKGAKKK